MTISKKTDDIKISSMKELLSPIDLINDLPMTSKAIDTVVSTREEIINILNGEDNRILLIVGPCSIHDIDAAHEYAEIMNNLNLANPKMMDVAVPANLKGLTLDEIK